MLLFNEVTTLMCCVGEKRIHDLYAAAFNILMNTTNNGMVICYNEPELSVEATERRGLLYAIADANKNELEWISFEKITSKASMIETALGASGFYRRWVMNVDDDYMIPAKTLEQIAYITCADAQGEKKFEEFDMLMYGQFDIINYKNHSDWSSERVKYQDILPFIKEHGSRLLVHHLMDENDIPFPPHVMTLPGQSTGSHLFRTMAYIENMPLREKMLNWPKGKRGYDDMLCKEMGEKGKIGWIVGSNSYHTDRTKKILDGELWKEDIFRDDQHLEGDSRGRKPETSLGPDEPPRPPNHHPVA